MLDYIENGFIMQEQSPLKSPLKNKGPPKMQKLVFFDLDGTILSGISSENAFLWHLIKNGRLGLKQWLASITFILKWFWKYKHYVLIKNKAYLYGLPVQEIREQGQAFVKQHLLNKLRPHLLARIEAHRDAGDYLILLTGSYDFLAQVFTDYLKLDHTEATLCVLNKKNEQYFSAYPPKQHPFAEEKLRIATACCQQHGVSLDQCAAYGNSVNDIILLSKVGQPVAVHPDLLLRRTAQKNNWEII